MANDTQSAQDKLLTPYHTRIAMGEKLDGTSLQPKGSSESNNDSKPQGGLSQANKK